MEAVPESSVIINKTAFLRDSRMVHLFPYFCSLSMSCPFLCAPERSLLQYLRFMHGLDDSFFFVTRQFLGGSHFFSLLLKI